MDHGSIIPTIHPRTQTTLSPPPCPPAPASASRACRQTPVFRTKFMIIEVRSTPSLRFERKARAQTRIGKPQTWRAGRSAVISDGGPIRMSLWMGCAPWVMRPGSCCWRFEGADICVWVRMRGTNSRPCIAPCTIHRATIHWYIHKTHRRHLRHGFVLRGDRGDGGVHLLAQDAVAAEL